MLVGRGRDLAAAAAVATVVIGWLAGARALLPGIEAPLARYEPSGHVTAGADIGEANPAPTTPPATPVRPSSTPNGLALTWLGDSFRTLPPLTPEQRPTFGYCPRLATAATNLHPVARIDAGNDHVAPRDLPHGDVHLVHVADLRVTDGLLGAGSGYDVATALGEARVTVSDRTLVAPVTLALIDGPSGDQRVAFTEVRLRATTPVRWVDERYLGISTDGGDGGFFTGDATTTPLDGGEQQTDAYLAVMDTPADPAKVRSCVLRHEPGGRVSGVIFFTGYGDGGYPTLLGLDSAGRVASLVHDGILLPWSMSGLPGTPPPGLG
jgi:hypothetical protein